MKLAIEDSAQAICGCRRRQGRNPVIYFVNSNGNNRVIQIPRKPNYCRTTIIPLDSKTGVIKTDGLAEDWDRISGL